MEELTLLNTIQVQRLYKIFSTSSRFSYKKSKTQFIAEVKDSTKKTRLIPFKFSTTQTYILELDDQYMRVYKDKGQVLSSGSPFEISTPYLEAELFDIKFAQSADVIISA